MCSVGLESVVICATLLLSVQCLAVVEIAFIFVYCCNQNKWIVRCSNSEIWLNLPTLLGSILTKMSKPFSFQMFSRLIWKWIQTLFIQEKFSFSLTTGRQSSGAGDFTQKLPAGSRTIYPTMQYLLDYCCHCMRAPTQYHPFFSSSPLQLTIGLNQCEHHTLGTFNSEEHLSSHVSEEPVVFQKAQTHPRISHKRSSTKKENNFPLNRIRSVPRNVLPCFLHSTMFRPC